jgi:hypothetical protein
MAGFLTTTIVSGDQVQVASPAQVPTLLVPSPLSSAQGGVFTFLPGNLVYDVLGFGLGADLTLYLLRETNGPVNVAVAAGTWTSAPSITHRDAQGGGSPTGPTVTIALASTSPGNLDDHPLKLAIEQGGALGVGVAGLAYDGGAPIEFFTLPVPTPATMLGTVAITPSVLALASGTALVFDQPASETLTLAGASLTLSAAGLKAATATSGSPVTLHAGDLLAAGVAAILANPRTLIFTTAGSTPGHAPATAVVTGTDYTGASQSETVNIAQTAASVSTTKAYASITSIAYAAAGGTDATVAIGYGAAYASVAELIGEFNNLAVAAPLAVTFFDAQSALGHFLGFSTTATGGSATLTLDASPASAAMLFGLTAGASASGAAAIYTSPLSGHTWTFAAGGYVQGESYLAGCVGPRCSISALTTAAQSAVTAFNTNPFGFFADGVPSDSAANTVSKVAAYETQRATWLADANAPRDLYFGVSSPWHTASNSPTTNASNITTNDAAVLSAFASAAKCPESVAHDDVYIPGAATLAKGFFRRAASIAWAAMRGRAPRVAATVAEGNVPEARLVAADGLTLARDENTSTTKLAGMDGAGFFVLQTASDGSSATFALGATRAGSTSRLRSDGDFAVACETARLVQAVVLGWKGQRPETNTSTGMMTDAAKSTRHDQVDAAISQFLRPTSGLPNCSGYTITIGDPPSGKFVDNGITPVTVTLSVLGTIQQVVLVVSATGTTITVNGGATAAA